MRFLVFQHIPVEHPGVFRDFFSAEGHTWHSVELDAGDEIPDLGQYDALWVMGGPMDIWQEKEYPWLISEKQAVRDAILDYQMAFLGFCLGAQLLADALGGEVALMREPEVGVMSVSLTEEGRNDPVFRGFDEEIQCLQWHSYEVRKLPVGGRVLCKSDLCGIQAFAIGETAYGIQYHIEQTPRTVPEWGSVPEYRNVLEQMLGPGALEALEDEVAQGMPAFNVAAERMYLNFLSLCQTSSTSTL